MSELYHDSRAPLGGPVYRKGWTVGVRVEHVEQTQALGRGADLERTSVELWGKADGGWVPEASLDAVIDRALAKTVAELDEALVELWAHRERLALEYLRRTGEGLHCPPGERLLTLLAEAERVLDRIRVEGAASGDQGGNWAGGEAQCYFERRGFRAADAPTLTPAELAAAQAQALRRLNHDEES